MCTLYIYRHRQISHYLWSPTGYDIVKANIKSYNVWERRDTVSLPGFKIQDVLHAFSLVLLRLNTITVGGTSLKNIKIGEVKTVVLGVKTVVLGVKTVV